jgi:methyl-accepting chemotaxis protein
MNIQKKSLVFLLLLPGVFILVLSLGLGFFDYSRDMDSARILLEAMARNIRDTVYNQLGEGFEMLRVSGVNPMTTRVVNRMGQIPEGIDNRDFSGLEEFSQLTQFLNQVSSGTSADLLFVGSRQSRGLVLSRDVALDANFDVRTRDYFLGAMSNPGIVFISEPRVSAEQAATPLIVITAARAVLGAGNQPIGVVAFNYNFNRVIELLSGLMIQYNVGLRLIDTESGNLLWQNANGQVYFYNPQDIRSEQILLNELGNPRVSGQNQDLVLRNQTDVFFETQQGRNSQLIQKIQIPQTRWALLVSIPRSRIIQQVLEAILPITGSFALLFLLFQAILFLVVQKQIIRPIIGISGNLEQLANADADLTVAIEVSRKDEIGKLAESFNLFVSKLKSLILDVSKAIEDTDRVKLQVSSTTEETSSAITQISANLESIREQMQSLDNQTGSLTTAIEQVSSNITSMEGQILNQSSMVEESTAAITQMIASLDSVNSITQTRKQVTNSLRDVAQRGKEQISLTTQTFMTMVEYIQRIKEMAGTINSIAAQTNLLSMNAAIEAAHAGDAGQGFAVVAEEIRNLADSSGKSSASITKLIKDIQGSVARTQENMGDTTKAFELVSQEVHETLQGFLEIEQSVAELNQGGSQILHATQEIQQVTQHIRDGFIEIRQGTQSMVQSSQEIQQISTIVTSGMVESASGAEEIVSSMSYMVDQSHELQTIVETLKHLIGRLKTK